VRADRGSVLVLGIGFIGICLLAIAVVGDVGSAFLQRRSLTAIADAAAIAGAQVIDLDAYYAGGATIGTALDAPGVYAATADAIARSGAPERIPGFRTVRIEVRDDIVHVHLAAPLRLTFFTEFAQTDIQVHATARLDYRGIRDVRSSGPYA
jgi:uncharacterized membrane protein